MMNKNELFKSFLSEKKIIGKGKTKKNKISRNPPPLLAIRANIAYIAQNKEASVMTLSFFLFITPSPFKKPGNNSGYNIYK